jgi:hypothetical protein
MPITRSAFSCGSAGKGNQLREMIRSHSGEGGRFPSDDEKESPNANEPLIGLVTLMRLINLPEVVKSATTGFGNVCMPLSDRRDNRGERFLKAQYQVLRDPARLEETPNISLESITGRWSCRKSERLIVVKTWGNSHRAKGPYFNRVSNNARSAD